MPWMAEDPEAALIASPRLTRDVELQARAYFLGWNQLRNQLPSQQGLNREYSEGEMQKMTVAAFHYISSLLPEWHEDHVAEELDRLWSAWSRDPDARPFTDYPSIYPNARLARVVRDDHSHRQIVYPHSAPPPNSSTATRATSPVRSLGKRRVVLTQRQALRYADRSK
ncbi:hypothetical protein JCM11491_004039 [Sporobolomyces phaffii]